VVGGGRERRVKKQRFAKTFLEERIDEYLDKKKVMAIYPDAHASETDLGGLIVVKIFTDRSPTARVLVSTTRSQGWAWQTAARMLGAERGG